jgi:hypothetical protein
MNNIKKYIKRHIYSWHRSIGIITIIPVIFWTCSGLMHPFLSHWFKPTIAHETVKEQTINKAKIKLSLQDVLAKNHIDRFKNFRLVSMDSLVYYQLKNADGTLSYYNAVTGNELKNGDIAYATYLARYFINDQHSAIKSITQQTEFAQQYKYVNRYLPVWKVSFNRADQMDVYVETSATKLATFNPTSRKVFLWVFDNFHSWSFLELVTSTTWRITLMIVLVTIIVTSAISGIIIYGMLWKKFKQPTKSTGQFWLRKYHRQIGITVSLFVFTFGFSGGYHATRKLIPNDLPKMVYQPNIDTPQVKIDWRTLPLDSERISNISVVKFNKQVYYQASYLETDTLESELLYYNANDGKLLKDGNITYSKFLSRTFNTKPENQGTELEECCIASGDNQDESLCKAKVLETKTLTKFDNREYGFVFKRLPVVKLTYDTPTHTAIYIDTKTSRLAARINDSDRKEGYSFAFLHKFLFMDWAGKNIRDLTMMLASLSILVVSLMGLVLFLKPHPSPPRKGGNT